MRREVRAGEASRRIEERHFDLHSSMLSKYSRCFFQYTCMVYIPYYWQGNHQIYGHNGVCIRFWPTLVMVHACTYSARCCMPV